MISRPFRKGLFAGIAIGYVFGTRAGRQRYEQIEQAVEKLKEQPIVRQAAEEVRKVALDSFERVGLQSRTDAEERPGQAAEYANIAGPGVNP